MKNSQFISLIKIFFLTLAFLFFITGDAKSYYTDGPIEIENVSKNRFFLISLREINSENDSKKCDCTDEASTRNFVILGYHIPRGPMFGVLGALIVAIITLSVYHIPFFVNMRVKAEIRQKMKLENVMEVLKMARNIQHEALLLERMIRGLLYMIDTRKGGGIIGSTGLDTLDLVAQELNITPATDVESMLAKAHNALTKHSSELVIGTNNFADLFTRDVMIYGEDKIAKEIDNKFKDIKKYINKLKKTFGNLKGLSQTDQLEELKKIEKKYASKDENQGMSDYGFKLHTALADITEIYAKKLK